MAENKKPSEELEVNNAVETNESKAPKAEKKTTPKRASSKGKVIEEKIENLSEADVGGSNSDKKRKSEFQELIEKGKAKGTLTNEEILEVLDESELDVENMD